MRFGIREIVFLLVLLALPAAAYLLVFQPRNTQIAEARQEIQKKQAKLRQLDETTRKFSDLGAEIDRLTAAVHNLEEKLPTERETDVIIKEVWRIATAQRLTPKSIRTDKLLPAAQYTELPIRMTLVGDFDGFYSFMLELEKLSRITRVNRMQLKKMTSEEGQMQADVTLSIFFDSSDEARSATASRSRT